jgi:Tol biopolymer transport system component
MLFIAPRRSFYCGTALLLCVLGGNTAFAGKTTRVNVASNGTQSNAINGDIATPSLSAEGRYVAFSSLASNLVTGDTNRVGDVFVHDTVTRKTERVSVTSSGVQGNKLSGEFGPGLSADGRYAVFSSDATNLVAGDTNKARDVFIHDRLNHTTERLSIAVNGKQANADSPYTPSISADGRYVAFASDASNLVTADTNAMGDVFVYDRITRKTERVSVASNKVQGNNASGEFGLSLSADGRYVVFSSEASNLVAGDTNNARDVFVHDRKTHKTERVSVASGGKQGLAESTFSSISANGNYVAFVSNAANLVSGDTNKADDVFVYDRETHTTERVSLTSSGVQGNDFSGDTGLSLSASGRYVAFSSDATNLVSGDTNAIGDFFVHDRQTHKTERVSVASNGMQAISQAGNLSAPNLNADGRYAVFSSFATNLVAGDTNTGWDVFVRDRLLDAAHQADLKITAAVLNPTFLALNGQGTYNYTVTNIGPKVVNDVSLVYLASGGIPVSFEPSQGRCGLPSVESFCRLGTLQPGRSLTLQVVVKAQRHPFNQQITVSSMLADPKPTNNTVASSTKVTK